jgi:hypothetical protein
MPISLKAASGGGSVVGGSLVPFPFTTQADITVEGVRYLRTGYIETDTAKFDNNFYSNTRATIFELNINFGGSDLASALYGNGNTLIGVYGTPAVKYRVSTNAGTSWSAEQLFPCEAGDRIAGIEYFSSGSIWVAATTGGRIYSSTDLTSWTQRYQHPNYDITQTRYLQIKAFGSIVVAVGLASSGGICTTSTNGTSYTARTLSPNIGIRSVASNGTVYVLGVSNNNPSTNHVLTTTDFTTFTPATVTSNIPLNNIVSFANGKFYSNPTSGQLFESTGGSTWTRLDALNLTNINPSGFVEYFDGVYFFGGTTRSVDGQKWQAHPVYTGAGNAVGAITLTKIGSKYWLYGSNVGNQALVQEGNNYLFAGTPIALTNGSSPATFVYYSKVKV